MIEEITIRGLGVIAETTLPLGPGFTALTGETGAGKTMVVSAVGLLVGGRADNSIVRKGSDVAVVEGRWTLDGTGAAADRVHEAGGDLDNGELVIARSLSTEGRSRAVVGGRGAPVSVLKELGDRLVATHGQSDQVRLRSSGAQRDALDRFAGPELLAHLDAYRVVYSRRQSTRAQLSALIAERNRRAREAEDLLVACEEIESLAPRPGEDVELSARAHRLANRETVRAFVTAAREALSADGFSDQLDAIALVESARRSIERAGDHDPALSAIGESLAEAGFVLADIAAHVSTYLATLEIEGVGELDAINERRSELAALTRKYGPTLDEVVDHASASRRRLAELEGDSALIEQLDTDARADDELLEDLASTVSVVRSKAGERLGAAVTAELVDLAMPDARVTVAVTQHGEFSVWGRDTVEFLMQPHPDVPPRPIARGASGGELSRLMLAIEVVTAETDTIPTFVFDEVDAGVGGAAAIEVGKRLAKLAQSAQVVVVTHLAQVAAFATNHLVVAKDRSGAVTRSSVKQLNGEERIREMARLLSGLSDSPSGLSHARELIAMASHATLESTRNDPVISSAP